MIAPCFRLLRCPSPSNTFNRPCPSLPSPALTTILLIFLVDSVAIMMDTQNSTPHQIPVGTLISSRQTGSSGQPPESKPVDPTIFKGPRRRRLEKVRGHLKFKPSAVARGCIDSQCFCTSGVRSLPQSQTSVWWKRYGNCPLVSYFSARSNFKYWHAF